jgi:S1-C subfamily serine protease
MATGLQTCLMLTCSVVLAVPQVAFADAATYTAKVVGWDAAKDIAVLRLSMPKQKVGVCY